MDEKLRLLKVSASRPEWQTASWAAVLALNTTMRGCEVKGLRWRDVDLMEKALTVRKSKTEAGERVIPLNSDALRVILALYERARQIGGTSPDHYVFPACEAGHIDATRPQTNWRTAWRNLTRVINCPSCGLLQSPGGVCIGESCRADITKATSPLAGLRFHDLRHHAITELAESQASDSTVMSIAGHVSLKCWPITPTSDYKRNVQPLTRWLPADQKCRNKGVTTQTTTQNRAGKLNRCRK